MNKPPAGSKIYIPTEMYIDRGRDDILGGLATIIGYAENRFSRSGDVWVKVKEVPNQFSLQFLLENQTLWEKEYGNQQARPDPDV